MSKNNSSFFIDFKFVPSDGFIDFYWPNNYNQTLKFRDKIDKRLFSFLLHHKDRSLLYLAHYHLMNELITIFDLKLIQKDFKKKKIPLKSFSKTRIFDSVKKNLCPGYPDFYKKVIGLRQSKVDQLKMYADENFIFLTNLYRKFIHKKKIEPFLLSLSNEISDFNVTTNISDQMMNFSEKNKIKVYYYPIDFFFKKSPLEIRYADNNARFIEEIVTLVNEIFIEFKCKLTKNLIIYIKKLLTNLDSYLTFFKNHILKKNRIPKNFWRISGKDVRRALLSHIVRETGGKVWGFDHGYGYTGEVIESSTNSEAIECDFFISPNVNCYNSFLNYFKYDKSNVPKVIISSKKETKQFKKKITSRRVLYLTNIFQGEDRWSDGLFISDYIAYDFHSRMINYLINNNYCVTHKPHPESKFFPNIIVKNESLYRVETKILQDIYKNYDIFIFDKIKTSALKFAKSKNLPIIVIPVSPIKFSDDFNKNDPKNKFLFQDVKRDRKGRIFINNKSLLSKIEKF